MRLTAQLPPIIYPMALNQLNLAVIVRTCDRPIVFLRRALHSIIAQTVPPSLVVVVDDGSVPLGVETELGKMNWRGIAWRHLPRDPQAKPNRSAALNRGIAMVNTLWISFLDDDDTWTPQFLERVASALANNETQTHFGGVVTQTVTVHERLASDCLVEKRRRPFNPELRMVDLAALAVGNRFTLNSMVVRKDVFAAVGAYREDLPVLEDWEFNVRAAARFHFEVIPEPLACYHQRPAGDMNANTMIDEHIRVKVLIRNEWLRADLAAGRIGLGQLALAGENRGLSGVLDLIRAWRDKLAGRRNQHGQ